MRQPVLRFRLPLMAAVIALLLAACATETPEAASSTELETTNLCHGIQPGFELKPGEKITSCNGHVTYEHQADGNIVTYVSSTKAYDHELNKQALYAWDTAGQDTKVLKFGADGHLNLYHKDGYVIRTIKYPTGNPVWYLHDNGRLFAYQNGNVDPENYLGTANGLQVMNFRLEGNWEGSESAAVDQWQDKAKEWQKDRNIECGEVIVGNGNGIVDAGDITETKNFAPFTEYKAYGHLKDCKSAYWDNLVPDGVYY